MQIPVVRETILSNFYAYEFLYLDICVISSLTLTGTSNLIMHFVFKFLKGNVKISLQYTGY